MICSQEKSEVLETEEFIMHKMKKIVAALFVVAALLAMAIPAFAAGNGAAPATDAAQTQQSESA